MLTLRLELREEAGLAWRTHDENDSCWTFLSRSSLHHSAIFFGSPKYATAKPGQAHTSIEIRLGRWNAAYPRDIDSAGPALLLPKQAVIYSLSPVVIS
jgi:hypothetical protein